MIQASKVGLWFVFLLIFLPHVAQTFELAKPTFTVASLLDQAFKLKTEDKVSEALAIYLKISEIIRNNPAENQGFIQSSVSETERQAIALRPFLLNELAGLAGRGAHYQLEPGLIADIEMRVSRALALARKKGDPAPVEELLTEALVSSFFSHRALSFLENLYFERGDFRRAFNVLDLHQKIIPGFYELTISGRVDIQNAIGRKLKKMNELRESASFPGASLVHVRPSVKPRYPKLIQQFYLDSPLSVFPIQSGFITLSQTQSSFYDEKGILTQTYPYTLERELSKRGVDRVSPLLISNQKIFVQVLERDGYYLYGYDLKSHKIIHEYYLGGYGDFNSDVERTLLPISPIFREQGQLVFCNWTHKFVVDSDDGHLLMAWVKQDPEEVCSQAEGHSPKVNSSYNREIQELDINDEFYDVHAKIPFPETPTEIEVSENLVFIQSEKRIRVMDLLREAFSKADLDRTYDGLSESKKTPYLLENFLNLAEVELHLWATEKMLTLDAPSFFTAAWMLHQKIKNGEVKEPSKIHLIFSDFIEGFIKRQSMETVQEDEHWVSILLYEIPYFEKDFSCEMIVRLTDIALQKPIYKDQIRNAFESLFKTVNDRRIRDALISQLQRFY